MEKQMTPASDMETLQGQFLVAMPLMDDKRFVERVLFVVEHNSQGAMAIAINEKMPNINFGVIYKELRSALPTTPKDSEDDNNISISPAMAAQPVLKGGPVQTNRGFLLYDKQEPLDGISFPVTSDVLLSASMDSLRDLAKKEKPGNLIFTLGYCGWAPGQLENELAQNVWLTVPYDHDLLFNTNIEKRYEGALKLLGVTRANLSAFGSRA